MKKLFFQKKFYFIIMSVLLIGCGNLPFFGNDSQDEEPVATTSEVPDTVTEEILAEFEAALMAAIPAALPGAVPAALPALKSQGSKHEEIPNLTVEAVTSIIDSARAQVERDGVAGANTNITMILPSIYRGITEALVANSSLPQSEKVDVMNTSAEAGIGSAAHRLDEKYLPSSSIIDGTDATGTAMNIISEACVSHLPDIVDESTLPDSAASITATITANISKITTDSTKTSSIVNVITRASTKALDKSNISAIAIQNSIGQIAQGITTGLKKIDTSKLSITSSDYASIAGYIQKGIAAGVSTFSNQTFGASDITTITSSSYNKMMEGFSTFPPETLPIDQINSISKQATSATVDAIGTYFTFNANEVNTFSNEFMQNTVVSADYFASQRPDFTSDMVTTYASSMMAGTTTGFATYATKFGETEIQSFMNSSIAGYTTGASYITSLSNENITAYIGAGSKATVAAMNDFMTASGFPPESTSGFLTSAVGGFVSNVGNIKRNYNVETNLGDITKTVATYSTQALTTWNSSPGDVNKYIEAMSTAVSSNISNIRIDGTTPISSSYAQDALTQTAAGFTQSLAYIQDAFYTKGITFDSTTAQTYIASGQTAGTAELTKIYTNWTQSDITSAIKTGITIGCLDSCTVAPKLEENLTTYYTQYIAPTTTTTYTSPTTTTYTYPTTTYTTPTITPPTITSTSPTSNATKVPLNTTVAITFSKSMDQTTINTTNIKLSTGQTQVLGSVSLNDAKTIATFTPTNALSYGTSYTATVTTAVKSGDGAYLASAYSSNFTTVAFAVTSTMPAHNATGVSISSSIEVTFSAAPKESSLTSSTFYLKNSFGISVSGTISVSNSTATFQPSVNLTPGYTYTFTVKSGSNGVVRNPDNGELGADTIISFTTASVP